jgi:transposase-like protein DUF772
MMGHHSRSESLFYYFRLEDQVPENHLLRLIDGRIDLDFIRAKLKESYSDTGRPAVEPELLPRMLLIGYLNGVTSERRLVEELRMHLVWRWFAGLGFDQRYRITPLFIVQKLSFAQLHTVNLYSISFLRAGVCTFLPVEHVCRQEGTNEIAQKCGIAVAKGDNREMVEHSKHSVRCARRTP